MDTNYDFSFYHVPLCAMDQCFGQMRFTAIVKSNSCLLLRTCILYIYNETSVLYNYCRIASEENGGEETIVIQESP